MHRGGDGFFRVHTDCRKRARAHAYDKTVFLEEPTVYAIPAAMHERFTALADASAGCAALLGLAHRGLALYRLSSRLQQRMAQ